MTPPRTFRLTPAVHDRIVELTGAGCYFKVAAGAAGIAERTFWRYMRTGREVEQRLIDALGEDHDLSDHAREPPAGVDLDGVEGSLTPDELWACWRLMVAVDRACDEAEARAVLEVRLAGREGDWQASSWWLERGRWRRWRKRESHEIEVASIDRGDDQALLGEEASRAMHDALRIAAAEGRGELPPAPAPAEVVEGSAQEVERPPVDQPREEVSADTDPEPRPPPPTRQPEPPRSPRPRTGAPRGALDRPPLLDGLDGVGDDRGW